MPTDAAGSADAATGEPRQARRRGARLTLAVVLGLGVLAGVLITAAGAPLFTAYSAIRVTIGAHLAPPMASGPSGVHLLGTDGLGRDIWSRILFGSRISLLVAVVSVVFGGLLGASLGLIAGYYRGPWDDLVMRLVDAQLSVPFLVLAIALVAVLGNGVLNVIIALMVTGWTQYARVVRAEVLSLREREYVASARAAGAGDARILVRHIAPNLLSSLAVLSTLEVGQRILTEASLSYLGLGVPPEIPDWGRMIADGQKYIFTAWWVSVFPGFAIMATVLALNMVGDWVRDVTDPRLRHLV